MLELFSLFLALLLVNVLSELFKLWIRDVGSSIQPFQRVAKNPIGGTVGLF